MPLLDRLDLSSTLTTVMTNVAEHPLTTVIQLSLLATSALFVFLILYTARDILLRSQSLLAQTGAVLLVSLLPLAGFLLYLLLRPARTIAERTLQADLRSLHLAATALDQKLATLTKAKRSPEASSAPPRVFEVTVKKGEKTKGGSRKDLRASLPLPT